MNRSSRVLILSVALAAATVAGYFLLTSNPLLGRWVDTEGFPSDGTNSQQSGLEFFRRGRFAVVGTHRGRPVTVAGKYTLLASNIVKLEFDGLPAPLNSKRFKYDKQSDQLIEEGAWIEPITYRREVR